MKNVVMLLNWAVLVSHSLVATTAAPLSHPTQYENLVRNYPMRDIKSKQETIAAQDVNLPADQIEDMWFERDIYQDDYDSYDDFYNDEWDYGSASDWEIGWPKDDAEHEGGRNYTDGRSVANAITEQLDEIIDQMDGSYTIRTDKLSYPRETEEEWVEVKATIYVQ